MKLNLNVTEAIIYVNCQQINKQKKEINKHEN